MTRVKFSSVYPFRCLKVALTFTPKIFQKNMESREFGSLTVKVYFHHDCLFVEVLHARDVIALDPNGMSRKQLDFRRQDVLWSCKLKLALFFFKKKPKQTNKPIFMF